MKVLGRAVFNQEIHTGRLSGVNGAPGADHVITLSQMHRIDVIDDAGTRRYLTFDHDPSDDELDAAVPDPVDVTPSRPAVRWRRIAELAVDYQALMFAASDAGFTTTERTKLATAATALRTRIKGLLP